MDRDQIKCYCGHTTYCDCGPKEIDFDAAAKEFVKGLCEKNNLSYKGHFDALEDKLSTFAEQQMESNGLLYTREDLVLAWNDGYSRSLARNNTIRTQRLISFFELQGKKLVKNFRPNRLPSSN